MELAIERMALMIIAMLKKHGLKRIQPRRDKTAPMTINAIITLYDI